MFWAYLGDKDVALSWLDCCRKDDPEPVKRLKREMQVALAEEDYTSAARIRDHPFMKLAVQIVEEQIAGRDAEAQQLQSKLQNVVKEHESRQDQ